MRKEIGQSVRKSLFAGIARELPGFLPSSDGGIPGHYWVFTRAQAAPLVWHLGYQQHRHEDWFSLEVEWSRDGSAVGNASIREPDEFSAAASGRFRLPRLWTNEDSWWQVTPAVHSAASLHDAAQWLSAAPVPLEEALGRVPAAVDDALLKLRGHLAPWLQQQEAGLQL